MINMIRKHLFFLLSITFAFDAFGQSVSQPINWEHLDEGLEIAQYVAPQQSIVGDHTLTILKIDPIHFDFNLFSAKEEGTQANTAKAWAEQENQIAIINAGMYRMDHATNLGYMKDYDFVNNSSENKDNAVVAFNRKDESVPHFQIIDKRCQDWDVLKNKYNSFSQSIRMIDCHQINKWSKQNKKWSTVAIGKDKKGNALFVISRSPYRVHDFINIVLQAPLDIYNLMYLEGGPEASFYLNHANKKLSVVGSYETGFNENNENDFFWKIPNVIGISKKNVQE